MIINREIRRLTATGDGACAFEYTVPETNTMVVEDLRLTLASACGTAENAVVSVEHAGFATDTVVETVAMNTLSVAFFDERLRVAGGDTLKVDWANAGEIAYLLEVFFRLEF